MQDRIDRTRRSYDAVATRYADEFADDLAEKPLDRALLDAFVELAQRRASNVLVGDLGCGPGYEARHLASRGVRVVGIDLSSKMIEVAEQRHAVLPMIQWVVGSLLEIPLESQSLGGAVAIHSIIHLAAEERAQAYRELARVVVPGGPLLLAFHVSTTENAAGSSIHREEWWNERVDLDGYFIDPDEVVAGLGEVGFAIDAQLSRGPCTTREFPSMRCYLLATRRDATR